MTSQDSSIIIAQTKKWINDVVIGCNFCPFAAKEMKRDSIHYEVLDSATIEPILKAVKSMLVQLDQNENIDTSFIILPASFLSFEVYLDLLSKAESLLVKENYEGVYQIASFHPEYLFKGITKDDPSNYTNRSPYPMFHFLREESVSRAIDSYPDINEVPERNIIYAREKGIRYMRQLWENSFRHLYK